MDKLLIYLGENLKINDQITIYQPSILDIAKYGENHYFNVVYKICSIPSDYKSELWDLGYNYSKLDDFDLFILLTRDIGVEDTCLLLGDTISLKDMALLPFSSQMQPIPGVLVIAMTARFCFFTREVPG